MYKPLSRSRIRLVLTSPAYLGVRNYLNNYYAMYTHLTRSLRHADLAYPYLLLVKNY